MFEPKENELEIPITPYKLAECYTDDFSPAK